MTNTLASALFSAAAALLGGLIGAIASYAVATRAHRLERVRLISSWTKSEEVERARVAAYRDLWICLGGISTYNSRDVIVESLSEVQHRLQEWYYDRGGGLFLTGSAEDSQSTKATFFAARDLRSTDAYAIWQVFHRLRGSLRRDLGVFESDADERAALEHVKQILGSYEK
jgi:hypothetical protein